MKDKGEMVNLEIKDRILLKSASLGCVPMSKLEDLELMDINLSCKNATQASTDIEYTRPEIASLLLLHKEFPALASQLELKS